MLTRDSLAMVKKIDGKGKGTPDLHAEFHW